MNTPLSHARHSCNGDVPPRFTLHRSGWCRIPLLAHTSHATLTIAARSPPVATTFDFKRIPSLVPFHFSRRDISSVQDKPDESQHRCGSLLLRPLYSLHPLPASFLVRFVLLNLPPPKAAILDQGQHGSSPTSPSLQPLSRLSDYMYIPQKTEA